MDKTFPPQCTCFPPCPIHGLMRAFPGPDPEVAIEELKRKLEEIAKRQTFIKQESNNG